MKKIIWLAAMALFVPLLALAQNNLDKSFNGIKKIRLSTSSGNCSVSKGSGNSVNVKLNHTYDESTYKPTVEQNGEILTIKEVFKSDDRRSYSGEANWTLTLPDGLELSVSSGSGDIDVSNLQVDINISTGSGNLEFNNIKGKLKGNTGSGDIEIQTLDGDMVANTGSGNIKVADSKGDISLNCGSGDIKFTNSQAAFAVNTGSGSITGSKITLKGKSSFNTGSGDSELVLAASPQYDVSINSGSGDAILDFNGNEIKGSITMRASKDHGKIVAPFEFDKTEEINNGGRNNTTIEKTVVKGNGTNRINIGTGSGNAVIRK